MPKGASRRSVELWVLLDADGQEIAIATLEWVLDCYEHDFDGLVAVVTPKR